MKSLDYVFCQNRKNADFLPAFFHMLERLFTTKVMTLIHNIQIKIEMLNFLNKIGNKYVLKTKT